MGNTMMGASNDLMKRKELGGGGGMAPPFAPPGMIGAAPGMATGGFTGEPGQMMMGGNPNSYLGGILNTDPSSIGGGGGMVEKRVTPGTPATQLGAPQSGPPAGIGPSSQSYADSQNYQKQRANQRRRPGRLGMF